MKQLLTTIFLSALLSSLPISSYSQGNSGMGMGMGGDDNELTFYNLSVNGGLSGGGTNWESSNNDQIHYQHFWPDAIGVLDVSYFTNEFNDGNFLRGDGCFGSSSGLVHSAILGQQKGGGAFATIWFDGYAHDGETEVLYRVRLDGLFYNSDNWLPIGDNTMTMTSWSMHLENQGRKVKNISCLGEGDFDAEDEVTILMDDIP